LGNGGELHRNGSIDGFVENGGAGRNFGGGVLESVSEKWGNLLANFWNIGGNTRNETIDVGDDEGSHDALVSKLVADLASLDARKNGDDVGNGFADLVDVEFGVNELYEGVDDCIDNGKIGIA